MQFGKLPQQPLKQSDTIQPNRLAFLDGLRGLAAVYVLLGHARWLLWEGFTEGFARHPAAYSMLGKLAAYGSLAFYYGHQAVIFFYVLSGFVIHLRYAKALKRDPEHTTFDLGPFFYRRLKRVYPLFLLAIIFTLALDRIGMGQGYAIYFQHTPYMLINQSVTADHTLVTGLRNLLLLPDAPTWGSNGPLWSLRTEWWFYLFYPLFWLLSKRSILVSSLVMFGLFALSFLNGLWPITLLQVVFAAMPAWWLGALLADLYTGRLQGKFWRVALLSGLFLILPVLVAPLVVMNEALQDFLWALGFTGLIAACLAWRNRGGSLALLDRLRFLGDLSYPLYVLHFPILTLVSGWLMAQSPSGTLPQDFGWIVIGSALCVGAASVVNMVLPARTVNSGLLLKSIE